MVKRLHKEQKLELKYKALLELEKDKTNKEGAQLFGVPANTLSLWKNNKNKIFQAFQQGSATTKRVKVDTYDQVNKAHLRWFRRLRSGNIPVNRVLIKEKALYFGKELTFSSNFQASDGWFDKWKKRLDFFFFYLRLFYYIITAI